MSVSSRAFSYLAAGVLCLAIAPESRAQSELQRRPGAVAQDTSLAHRRADLRRQIRALDAARAERIRAWLVQHPGAPRPPDGAVLIDVTPAGDPVYVGNNPPQDWR